MTRKKKNRYCFFGKRAGFHRFRKYSLDEVLPWISENTFKRIHVQSHVMICKGQKVLFSGKDFDIPVGEYRHLLWLKGTECLCCGLKGTHLWLERCGNIKPHLNLYGINENGKEVMLTTDHIVARSKGGTDDMSNLQLLCIRCNMKKSNSDITIEQLRKKMHIVIEP